MPYGVCFNARQPKKELDLLIHIQFKGQLYPGNICRLSTCQKDRPCKQIFVTLVILVILQTVVNFLWDMRLFSRIKELITILLLLTLVDFETSNISSWTKRARVVFCIIDHLTEKFSFSA